MNDGSKQIRTFIALEFSQEARDELVRVEGLLKEADANVKWVDPAIVHLTLKFLGNVAEDKIDSISGRLDEIASRTSPFDLSLDGIGVFPKWDYVKVLWVGIAGGSDQVKKLAESVDAAMSEEGFKTEERDFSPHITIGRVRTAKRKEKLREIASNVRVEPVTSHITGIVLFKSELSPKGAIHTPLSVLDFRG